MDLTKSILAHEYPLTSESKVSRFGGMQRITIVPSFKPF